jgi:hypothetical protein
MPTERKHDLMTPSKAASLLGVARNTVMHRIATQRYASEVVGGITFVVRNAALEADIAAKRAAA